MFLIGKWTEMNFELIHHGEWKINPVFELKQNLSSYKQFKLDLLITTM